MNLIKQSNLLKCTLDGEDRFSDAQFIELAASQDMGLLKCQKVQLNGVMTLTYDIKAYNTLESCASHLTAVQFRLLVRELLLTLRHIQKQSKLSGLTAGNLRVEFDKIYVHNDTLRPAFIYTPVETEAAFAEADFREELIHTIAANECLRDDANEQIRRFLADPGSELLTLIDIIPTLRDRDPEPQPTAAPVTAKPADDRQNRSIQILFLLVGVLILLILAVLVVLLTQNRGGTADSAGESVVLMRGDLDGNGKVEDEDYRMLTQYLNGELDLSESQRKAADIDRNGRVEDDDLAAFVLLQLEGTES